MKPGKTTGKSKPKSTPPRSKGAKRKRPGTGGAGENYHIEVRPSENFVTFRTQDVGDPGHIQRVAGKRASGSWGTVKWLISKEDAHVEDGTLIPDTEDARDLLAKLGEPTHVEGDVFKSKSNTSQKRGSRAKKSAS